MDFVQTGTEIFANIAYLDDERLAGGNRAIGFIKRGTCFVVYGHKAPYKFAPSRFVGYRNNSFEAHAANKRKDGKLTNPVISSILGSQPIADSELEKNYKDFCRALGFEPNATGAFGVERKFWDMRK